MKAKYTKVPNDFLDSMSELKPAAFKLAVALYRLTNGWQKTETTATLDDLEKLTGLSRQGIINAKSEIGHLFAYMKRGRSSLWIVVGEQSTELTEDKATSQQSRPLESTELTNNGQRSRPTTTYLKKSFKENSKDKGSDSDTSVAEMKAAILTVTKMPAWSKNGKVDALAENLIGDGRDASIVLKEYRRGGWWYECDWRGKKGQKPTLFSIGETINVAVEEGHKVLGVSDV
ncbi:MAG TPA: hypothetical protein ENI05_10685 [Porticoccus sp.]|nr:hypothetical protein [Porticoccus sp.]